VLHEEAIPAREFVGLLGKNLDREGLGALLTAREVEEGLVLFLHGFVFRAPGEQLLETGLAYVLFLFVAHGSPNYQVEARAL
jgi:hypothetical protein